ncbi:MAG: prenyltransferase/squalene oxidase repeat-containing protein, partial [Solirubrobacteraceae bacterium]
MSWQLGAFAILAVALAGGFAWYERRRPDARIVALVGTLAALGALGRIAFAAVPNVKPTTDIVLIAGYALGGGPGFAVGALAALSSNFFFGQGPWTPWQMAGWGATGMIGAGLAVIVRHVRDRTPPTPPTPLTPPAHSGPPAVTSAPAAPAPLGRWSLAIVCGAVGFGFTALQDVGDWVTYSDHSSAQLAAYVGQGLGFDAIHAAGCVGFALAIGPALTRSVARFARRLSVTWLPEARAAGLTGGGPLLGVLVAVLAGAAVVSVGAAGVTAARAATIAPAGVNSAAVSYLLRAENPDGGFGAGPGQPSNELYTGWAALGLAAAGHNLQSVGRATSLIGYVRASSGSSDPGALERTILVVAAAGLPARSFGGRDLVAELERDVQADGSIHGQVNWTAFGVLALRAAEVAVPARMLTWLAAQQDRDGGFSFAGKGGASDVDDTGAALQALAADRAASAVREQAVSFLHRQQNRDGGFPSLPGMSSNSQSTAWAVQGLLAAGVAPSGFRRAGGPSPLDYLRSLAGSNGAIAYARGMSQTPVWVT